MQKIKVLGFTPLETNRPKRLVLFAFAKRRFLTGFTLIEVLIATFLTTIISVSILPLFINSIIVNSEVKKNQIASKIAESKIEEYRTKSYEDIKNLQPNPKTNPAETFAVSSLPNGVGNVYIYDYGSDENLKRIEVKIQWRGRKNQTKNITFNTLMGKYGSDKD